MTGRTLHLNVNLLHSGVYPSAWRLPGSRPDAFVDIDHFIRVARIAERGKLDAIFLADTPAINDRIEDRPFNALEPTVVLAAVAAVTSHVGLVATASTTYNEPYHIARKFASLDHISRGRAGWNIVTSWSEQEAWNFSRTEHLDYDTRYERAREFVDVVTGLWDSWEPDAFVHDKASGQFYDPAKLHVLHHKGKHFQVRGPLSVKPTPQGRPILVQAGANAMGQEIAAADADVVYASNNDFGAAKAYYASVKGRMAQHGRDPDLLKIMPALVPIVGRTEAEANAKLDQLQSLIDPLAGLARVHGLMGDLSGHDLDGPVPEPVNAKMKSMAYSWWERSQREGLTIRQMYSEYAIGEGFRLIGTPSQIVDTLEQWRDEGAADGFNITPTHLPGGMEDFSALVVPELRRRGLIRLEYEGKTLRENLGLPPYRSRWSR